MKYARESLEAGQHQSVKRVEIELDKGKTMEKIRIYKQTKKGIIHHDQFIKRGSKGRFQHYMTQDERLSLLLGILFAEVVVLLWII